MRSIYVLAALSCFTVVACGDDTTSHGGKDLAVGADMAVARDLAVPPDDLSAGVDMSTGVTWAKFSLDFAHARCAQLMSCGQLDAAQLDTCIAQNLQLTGWDIDTEIAKGRLLLNETQCIAAVSAARCDGSDSAGQWSQRCSTLLYVPQQNNGAVCLSGVECTSDYCAHAANTAGTAPQPTGCPGVCAAIKAAGVACQTDDQCGPDSFCDNDNGGDNTNTCVAYLGVGDACGAITNPKQTCHPGTSYCPSSAPIPCARRRRRPGAQGDACDPSQAFSNVPPCQVGLFCQLNAARDGASCQPKIAAGRPATAATTSRAPVLQESRQSVRGRHRLLQLRRGRQRYRRNLRGLWRARRPLQGDCFAQTNSSCKIGFACVTPGTSQVGTCQPLVPTGDACVSGGLACAQATPVLSGGVCIADNGDAGGATTCQTPKGFGDSCLPDFQDDLCWPSADPTAAYPTTSYCAPTSNGNGVCAPRCN